MDTSSMKDYPEQVIRPVIALIRRYVLQYHERHQVSGLGLGAWMHDHLIMLPFTLAGKMIEER